MSTEALQFGILVPQDAPFPTLIERWRRAEELGFDHLWITVGGQSPTVLRVAAERADCWNTHGPFSLSIDEIVEITRRQNDRLNEMCAAFGRDPTELRRSLLLFGALDAWASTDALERVVRRFREVGIGEFVVFWPASEQLELFERVVAEVIPTLKRLETAERNEHRSHSR